MKISKPSPNLARNDFDLSHRFVVSENFGELNPVSCIETVPDGYYEIQASNLIRAIPMQTSPFLRAKQHIDVWFVPMTDLWHNFNQFIVGRKDPLGSAFHDYRYCPHANLKSIVDGIYTFVNNSAKDIVGLPFGRGAQKIFNYLGYGDFNRINAIIQDDNTKQFSDVNLWRVLAYNKIWYDEYRNKYYDDGTHLLGGSWLANASGLFSVDDLACDSVANAAISGSDVANRLVPMFQMRYRQWKKDLFTGVLPSTQFGAVSSVDAMTRSGSLSPSPSSNNQYLTGSATGTLIYRDITGSLSPAPAALTSSFDVLSLRKSEAIQKWRQIALMSGNSAYDNMRGHYGVTPDHDRDHRPTYLGSVDAPLNIGDINAQAETGSSGNAILGSVAGKALSSVDQKVFKFKANDFGIIMCLHSVLPEAEYNSFGLDRPNQLLETDDYFKPEYQNLGLEAVGSFDFDVEDVTGLSALGYAPRYYCYKQKIDKVGYYFANTGSSSMPFSTWVSPKYDILATLGSVRPLAGLYVNPKIYDNNFVAGYDVSEQFMNDQYLSIKAVQPMSELGLPSF